ncbi:hypothetical protein C0992_006537 [Termitomyces sp. T32_za158]|nr:hypothetical protein C0992_006537 [Termitomyces sp. T32_za158]
MMEDTMEVDVAMAAPDVPQPQAAGSSREPQDLGVQTPPPTVPMPSRDAFRDIQVKVHIRRPERDSWVYMGRGVVSQDVSGHSSRVGAAVSLYYSQSELNHFEFPVVRTLSTGKIMAVFSEVRI